MEIPECFYRVSVKALILNKDRDKFLVCEEAGGYYDLPGGGLDWGATPQTDLAREIKEEMGLKITKVADRPCYFVTDKHMGKGCYRACVIYETELEHLDFKPSDECVGIKFVDKTEVASLKSFEAVCALAEQFSKENHLR